MTTLAIDRPNLRSPYWVPSNSSNSLNHEHIIEALDRSPDGGETLVFSKLDLTDISVDAAEELATKVDANGLGVVKRIALGNNRLTTLPTELALLTRLRYLNLKHNSFSSFPRALTLVQSLDTLDISHNKIRRLPNDPGNLVNLRVFCFSRNKISRLPTYLTQFHNLEVLRADRNPIEWPPKAVMEFPGSDDLTLMKEWIPSVQNWIETESARSQIDDSVYHERAAFDKSIDESWRFPLHSGDSDEVAYHGRSYSMDSNASLSSITESLHETSSPEVPSLGKPPPLHLGILGTASPEPSPTHSFEGGVSPTSDYDRDLEIPGTFEQMQNFDPLPLHTRTASYAEGTRSPLAATILAKKSLPDLRKAHVPIIDSTPTPSMTRSPFHFVGSHVEEGSYHHSSPSSFSMRPRLITLTTLSDVSDTTPATSPHDRIASMATERNSYFRRLSTYPSHNPLPQHLTNLAESARSFLFAMCQIYQSLEQYAALVIDDRFSVVLRKVLDPAHFDMMQFIQALERFDSISRSSLPAPTICRTLLEKCRDCAAAFGKAVNVLVLRLQVDPGEDLRFSRWMLVEMYAAAAEIAGAWTTMQAHIDSLKSYLRAKDPITSSHISENVLEVPSQHTLRVGISGRNRTARRHAGSFSSKDVEIGKKLPSYETPSTFTGGVLSGPAPHIPTLRTPKRQLTAPVLSSTPKMTSPPPFWHQNSSEERLRSHARQGSQKSNSNFSPSSPSLVAKSPNLDLPGNSKRKVDFEALNAIQNAVDAAPGVWDMIADALLTAPAQNDQAHAVLQQAQSVTRKLSDIIHKMHTGDLMSERRILQEDAQLFVKVVIKISNLVKAHSVNHPVASSLRSSIIKLTNLTEEFAILLHVSSFTPSTTRSFSPMLMNSSNFNHDGRLTSNLSRTKSAHSPTIKIPHPALNDGPRSALPTQSFKIPEINVNRRLRSTRDARLEATITEPG
ncbi:hypothetical protein P691DRAFT_793050 [Macrolepiota fuliginosa MF-IS2]|uniref:RAM signaling network component n=1 Tax=Macrolepiota fuliginosa MF-IS2 TaxID=1400762 RepID=A0A9P6C663_9AGAR|nr:hypothetical protein P691DRAFT_793050 [Macrolepiota fuliginosa MF-IS2]